MQSIFFPVFIIKLLFYFKVINNWDWFSLPEKSALEEKHCFLDFLFFNTTDSQTFYKVALEEWVEDRNRNSRNNPWPWPVSFGRQLQAVLTYQLLCNVIHVVLDLHKQILQWIQVMLDERRALNQSFQNPSAVNSVIVAIPGMTVANRFGRRYELH